ncbi:MAG: T9SS C-terminal target domain-containing protein [Calditrichaeota bacterium]|nr:MAG: T9SS C-terminal target domain-containing protein [Calditrichota bacterium]
MKLMSLLCNLALVLILFVSNIYAQQWEEIDFGNTLPYCSQIQAGQIKEINSGVLIASTFCQDLGTLDWNRGFGISSDNGITWSKNWNLGDYEDFTVNPNNSNEIVKSIDEFVFKSVDGGITWFPFSEGLPTIDICTGADCGEDDWEEGHISNLQYDNTNEKLYAVFTLLEFVEGMLVSGQDILFRRGINDTEWNAFANGSYLTKDSDTTPNTFYLKGKILSPNVLTPTDFPIITNSNDTLSSYHSQFYPIPNSTHLYANTRKFVIGVGYINELYFSATDGQPMSWQKQNWQINGQEVDKIYSFWANGNGFLLFRGIEITINNSPKTIFYSNDFGQNWQPIETTISGTSGENIDYLNFVSSNGYAFSKKGDLFYRFDLNQVITSIDSEKLQIPTKFSLSQNYPNPFNPTTRIEFAIPQVSNVQLQIFNVKGRLVKELANSKMNVGFYNFDWNGTDSNGTKVSSGIYFYKLETEGFIQTKKMILLK